MIFVNIMVWVYVVTTLLGFGVLVNKLDDRGRFVREPMSLGSFLFSLTIVAFAYYAASLFLGLWVWIIFLISVGLGLNNYDKEVKVNLWYSMTISLILAFFALKGIGVL